MCGTFWQQSSRFQRLLPGLFSSYLSVEAARVSAMRWPAVFGCFAGCLDVWTVSAISCTLVLVCDSQLPLARGDICHGRRAW